MNDAYGFLMCIGLIGFVLLLIAHIAAIDDSDGEMEWCYPLAFKTYYALDKFTAFGRWFLTIPVIILESPLGIVSIITVVLVKGVHNIFVKEKW